MRIPVSLLAIVWIIPIALSQTADSSAKFEVVSVKPHLLPPNTISFRTAIPDTNNRSTSGIAAVHAVQAQGNRFYRRDVNVQELILDAYGLWDFQVIGLPEWAKSNHDDRYEVDARAAEGTMPTPEELQSMLQNLLAERFQFKAHRDSGKVAVYSLERGTGSLNMRKLGADEQPPRYSRDSATEFGAMDSLAGLLARPMGRPVLNHTALEGTYEYSRLYDSETFAQMIRGDPQGLEALIIAGAQKLGLKLVPRNEEMPVLVVDRVERTSAN